MYPLRLMVNAEWFEIYALTSLHDMKNDAASDACVCRYQAECWARGAGFHAAILRCCIPGESVIPPLYEQPFKTGLLEMPLKIHMCARGLQHTSQARSRREVY